MIRLLTVLGLLLLAFQAGAQSMSVIELQSRPAAEVIPIIEPMLGPNDAISGEGFKLFLRASPATEASIREMIDFLDEPAKVVEVSVFQGSARDLRRIAANASVQVDNGNVRVDVGEEGDDDAAGGVRLSTTDGNVSVNGTRTQGSLRDNPIHRVRVTEGTEAYIETGQQVPEYVSTIFFAPFGAGSSVQYRDALTGFYVLPRVRGDNVVLDVSPYKSAPIVQTGRTNEISTQSASTTITGRLGEWMLIGGVSEQVTESDSRTGTTVRTQGSRDSGIWIKADLAR